jgi:hypothetical protein
MPYTLHGKFVTKAEHYLSLLAGHPYLHSGFKQGKGWVLTLRF